MFSQIPSPANPELWAGIAAAAGAAFVFLRKILKRKAHHDPPVTRSEFHSSQEAMRNRIGASHLALADKIDIVLARIDAQSERFERRIDQLEMNMARMDERTRSL